MIFSIASNFIEQNASAQIIASFGVCGASCWVVPRVFVFINRAATERKPTDEELLVEHAQRKLHAAGLQPNNPGLWPNNSVCFPRLKNSLSPVCALKLVTRFCKKSKIRLKKDDRGWKKEPIVPGVVLRNAFFVPGIRKHRLQIHHRKVNIMFFKQNMSFNKQNMFLHKLKISDKSKKNKSAKPVIPDLTAAIGEINDAVAK